MRTIVTLLLVSSAAFATTISMDFSGSWFIGHDTFSGQVSWDDSTRLLTGFSFASEWNGGEYGSPFASFLANGDLSHIVARRFAPGDCNSGSPSAYSSAMYTLYLGLHAATMVENFYPCAPWTNMRQDYRDAFLYEFTPAAELSISNVVTTPEPSTLWIGAVLLLGLLWHHRRTCTGLR